MGLSIQAMLYFWALWILVWAVLRRVREVLEAVKMLGPGLAELQPMDHPTIEEIRGAVARGWCAPVNSHKEMDAELASAIANEVHALLESE
jgi:hypothetical protein